MTTYGFWRAPANRHFPMSLSLIAFYPQIDPQTKKVYVLVSEEAYERMQALLAPERLPRSEQQALLHAAGLRAGWDDPEMDIYDED